MIDLIFLYDHFSSGKAPSSNKKPKIFRPPALKSQNNSIQSTRPTSSTNDSNITSPPPDITPLVLVKSELSEATENDHIQIDDAIPPEEGEYQDFEEGMGAEYEDSSYPDNVEPTEPNFTTAGVKGTFLII